MNHRRIVQQVLRVHRPDVALAGAKDDGYDAHAHLIDQARGDHLATDLAGGDLALPMCSARIDRDIGRQPKLGYPFTVMQLCL